MSKQSGYYRFPAIHDSRVVFVCEDDLWSVAVTGGVAIRLTSNLGEVSHPFLSPDGAQLAFIGREEAHPEVYVMPSDGGVAKRLTFLGTNTTVVGWSSDGKSIIFASNAGQPFRRIYNLYQISPEGGLGERLPLGLASHVSYGANGGVVIGRNTSDIARWKRYRGGTTGVIWIDSTGTGNFRKLIDLPGNFASPMWVGERIYFISDHEQIGNLYSCNHNGEDVIKHTYSQEYYVRNATTDGKRIVYHAGAELFCFDPEFNQNRAISVEFHSPQVQRQRKFIDAANYLENYNLHPDGHYRPSPDYRLGFLGADFSYDPATDAYRVEHIAKGDSWNEKVCSPLNTLGANIQVGDLLLWVGGQRVGRQISPQELLVNKANSEVTLTFAGRNSEEYRTITVKTLGNDSKLRYREWVERNREIVREKTNSRVGYLHIPDMGPSGYAEFHRYYAQEVEQEGLIIDVRYNGGGHVSQLLLEKLARQRIGYNVSRWGQPQPYPHDSPAGLILAITNEQAGSDGDIFSHCFKLMKLGTLIGKRTWGGVIGIWPRHRLVDGSVLTQPEFSFWFKDVGWGVENYGTDPDIEVEIAPQDWAQGKDPQLEQGISLILEQLQENPVKLPEFGARPILKLPE